MRMKQFVGPVAAIALALVPIVADAAGVGSGDMGDGHKRHLGSSTLVLAVLGVGAVIAGAVALGSKHDSGTPASA